MTAEQLLKIRAGLLAKDIDPILDGGWGTDALLGHETRPHKDMDFLIEKRDLEAVKAHFRDLDYDYHEELGWWHFNMQNGDTELDIHVVEIDETGKGIYGPPEYNAFFPAEALAGHGTVNGEPVRCLTADYRILCLTRAYGVVIRTGYNLKPTDYQDIAALCDKFNIEMPEEFKNHI